MYSCAIMNFQTSHHTPAMQIQITGKRKQTVTMQGDLREY